MKIFTINFKSFLRYFPVFLFIVLLIIFISTIGFESLGVYATERELPIYCVDTGEKVAAITFDCAWVAVP